jgi:hypothetical protein
MLKTTYSCLLFLYTTLTNRHSMDVFILSHGMLRLKGERLESRDTCHLHMIIRFRTRVTVFLSNFFVAKLGTTVIG